MRIAKPSFGMGVVGNWQKISFNMRFGLLWQQQPFWSSHCRSHRQLIPTVARSIETDQTQIGTFAATVVIISLSVLLGTLISLEKATSARSVDASDSGFFCHRAFGTWHLCFVPVGYAIVMFLLFDDNYHKIV